MYAVALARGGGDIERYYANAVSTPAAFCLAVVFVAAFFPVLGRMDAKRGWKGFEGILRRISGG